MVPRPTLDSTDLASDLLEPIPANRSFGIEVLHAAHASAEVCMLVPQEMTNVIGSLHSSGLIALVDATGLAALISAATEADQLEGVIPLGSVARIEFLAPAHGLLVGRCTVAVDDLAAIESVYRRRRAKAELMTVAEIYDSRETLVCRGSFTWVVRRDPVTRTEALP
jgi:acyl-coenzyme A thioesterase PaaI-like protein